MKYYCENCGVEFVYPDSRGRIQTCAECIVVKTESHILKEIPVHETVAQWEARTGRKYPDTAPAYYFSDRSNSWRCAAHNDIFYDDSKHQIVATEAGAPPDDWRPE